MSKQYNYVYITTNLINEKKYVGDHSTNNLEDEYLGSGTAFFAAINKYGKENFKRKILEQFESKQEAFEAQEKWINEYNTLAPNGYNLNKKGGTHYACFTTLQKIKKSNTGQKRSLETRLKISKAKKGKKLSEEHKQNISKAFQKNGSKKGKNHHMYGKKLSEEHKQALITSRIGKFTIYSDKSKKKMSESAKNRKKPSNMKPFSKKEIEYITIRYKNSITYSIIAKEMGIHRGRVQRYINNNL